MSIQIGNFAAMKWVFITQLTLYGISKYESYGYFEYDNEAVSFDYTFCAERN